MRQWLHHPNEKPMFPLVQTVHNCIKRNQGASRARAKRHNLFKDIKKPRKPVNVVFIWSLDLAFVPSKGYAQHMRMKSLCPEWCEGEFK
jgi:hypothetical protein